MDKVLDIKSPAFRHLESLPAKYTCDGLKVNPPLTVSRIPGGTKSLALIFDDPDAPGGMFVHWVVWNIPVTAEIRENSIPGKEGMNDYGRQHYGPPCPPRGSHRYTFHVYALDTLLDLPPTADKGKLEKAMQGHVLAWGEIVGRYEKARK